MTHPSADMTFPPLPARAANFFKQQEASGRLVRHHILVHAMAQRLCQMMQTTWPALAMDTALILMGAAIHDTGKLQVPEEITGSGHTHEQAGERMLLEHGFNAEEARFARTHGMWPQTALPLEDLMVCMADTIWTGKRVNELEEKLCSALADRLEEDFWQVFQSLDEVLMNCAAGGEERLVWAR